MACHQVACQMERMVLTIMDMFSGTWYVHQKHDLLYSSFGIYLLQRCRAHYKILQLPTCPVPTIY